MEFDRTVQADGVDYGILRGEGSVVFVKPGLGTDCRGYADKYVLMAHRLRDTCGFRVIVASNPHDGLSHADTDLAVLEQFVGSDPTKAPELLFFGSSNGCIKGLELTARGVSFRRMVLVNMPLMIYFHKTKGYLGAIPRTAVTAVYGERDPSFAYTPFLEGRFPHVKVMTIPRADHNFTGMREEFILLSRLLTDGQAAGQS